MAYLPLCQTVLQTLCSIVHLPVPALFLTSQGCQHRGCSVIYLGVASCMETVRQWSKTWSSPFCFFFFAHFYLGVQSVLASMGSSTAPSGAAIPLTNLGSSGVSSCQLIPLRLEVLMDMSSQTYQQRIRHLLLLRLSLRRRLGHIVPLPRLFNEIMEMWRLNT